MAPEYYVLEGDWGGQIYLTIPVRLAPDRQRLEAALLVIDGLEWPHNEGGTSCYLSPPEAGGGIGGGMGGGLTTDQLWLHQDLLPSLKSWVPEFLAGRAELPSASELYQWYRREDKYAQRDHSAKDWQETWRYIDRRRRLVASILSRP